ncbi:MAG: terminase [Lachnospiraceae bacterium]|nr:terminase [Lachnospiraceae bacterium]
MPKRRSENRDKAFEIFKEHDGKITNRKIAEMLNEKENTISNWKCKDKWNVVLRKNDCSTTIKRKHGGQPGNKNAVGHGAPPRNKNAEKFGFFSKYLPEETVSIIQEMPTDPLDILWDQIQIAYAAIIRAQQIMYVRDAEDKTVEKVERKDGNVIGEKWEVQQAWDKQANFLSAQARAQKELGQLIHRYDELLHKNWELATEEQKTRIEQMRANTERIRNLYSEDSGEDGVVIVNDAPASEDLGDHHSEVSSDI